LAALLAFRAFLDGLSAGGSAGAGGSVEAVGGGWPSASGAAG